MSTIAYKDGIIAGDTAMSRGDMMGYGVCKIGRTKKYLFGYAGRTSRMLPLFDWILECESECSTPDYLYKFRDSIQTGGEDLGAALVVNADGEIWTVTTEGFSTFLPGHVAALGNGDEYASGALAMGASAVQAIEVACTFDCYSGGRVLWCDFSHKDIVKPHVMRS